MRVRNEYQVMIANRYDREWDVIIVGAGPGGSKCAQEFAKRGMKTLVIDRKQEIGAPKRCGEGLSGRWYEAGGLKPKPTWSLQKIDGVIVISPSGKQLVLDTGESGQTGYIIERKMFEKDLAADAIRAGAKYMLKGFVYDVMKEGDYVVGVKVKHEGKEKEFRSKIVIAADGVDSKVARFAGMKTAMGLYECDSGYQYEMAGVELLDENKLELYFGKEVAPRGYVWVFPKGKDIANVGIGIAGSNTNTAKYYLDRWIEKSEKRFKNASILEINAGVIPVTAPLKEKVGNGIMLVGDSARMVNPIHGGGMGSALEAAIMAAGVGTNAIKEGNVSKERLSEYNKIWYEKRGREFEKILKVRHFFEKLDDKQMEALMDVIKPEDVLGLAHGATLGKVAKLLMKASPNAAKFAMTFIK